MLHRCVFHHPSFGSVRTPLGRPRGCGEADEVSGERFCVEKYRLSPEQWACVVTALKLQNGGD